MNPSESSRSETAANRRQQSVEIVNGCEPLLVMTDASGRGCEHRNGSRHNGGYCSAAARWYIERCPMPDESYLPPVRYVCSKHIAAACNELLEARRERRQV